uniref:RNA-directed RNA polymerase catalytic subunit n=1 Tax=Siamese algae-eater influenza-like virus TaxID=2777035 RepID=A0A866W028_9ORTO|nr:polymerase basic 1 [Siamese algae-eater influenza-like virus]
MELSQNINPFMIFFDLPVQAGISTTFPYTGTPPYSHGTGTGYTIETVNRTHEYARAGKRYKSGITGLEMIDPTNGPLPTDNEPWACAQVNCVLEALDEMDESHPGIFENACSKAMTMLQTARVDKLTQGRQTYDWTVDKNQPAATALNTTISAFKLNGLAGSDKGTLLDFCKDVVDSWELNEVEFNTVRSKKKKEKANNKKGFIMKRVLFKTKDKLTKRQYLLRSLSLNTMTKDAERGKLKRRAIATPGMQIRGFVLVVETMAKHICEELEQSGLPVGGNEKKAKLNNAVQKMLSTCPPEGVSFTVTGDNTKWNECLSPRVFLALTERISRYSPEWFRNFLAVAPTLFSNKVAKLGRGFNFVNPKKRTKCQIGIKKLFDVDLYKYNEETQAKLKGMRDFFEDGVASLSPGMMMGMFNMLSTVVGVAVLGMKTKNGPKWDARDYEWDGLQSSDDFALFVNGRSRDAVKRGVNDFYRMCKLVGINMSKKKSYMNRTGCFEFTSMFYRNGFVANFAMDLPSFGVAGVNESADMAIGMTIIKNNMINNGMGPATAQTAIQLFIADYRYTYRCHRGDSQVKGKRMKLIRELWEKTKSKPGLLVADGGPNLYNIRNLGIPEAVIKWDLMDSEYKGRVFHPENPFVHHEAIVGMNEALVTPAHGPVKKMEYDAVASTHSWMLKRNRSILNTDQKAMISEEKCYFKCCNIFEAFFSSSVYKRPTGMQSMLSAIKHRARLDARLDLEGGRLTEAEYGECMAILANL